MIKLIASDIDGTLLKEGTMEINKELFSTIRKLNEKGIAFVAASGRSIESMESLFEPVKNEIYFVSENGAYIRFQEEEMSLVTIAEDIAEEFIHASRKIPEVTIVASVKDMLYIEGKNDKLYKLMSEGYRNNVEVVEDVLKIEEPFIKISLYKKDAIMDVAEEQIKRWENQMNTMVAGSSWLDCVGRNVDKGKALHIIQQKLQITYEETMAFGDNHNDIGMLKEASFSYAVANAADEVKETAKYLAASNQEDGVLKILQNELLQGNC